MYLLALMLLANEIDFMLEVNLDFRRFFFFLNRSKILEMKRIQKLLVARIKREGFNSASKLSKDRSR